MYAEQLKASTRQCHDSVEQQFTRRLFSPKLTADDYASQLTTIRNIYALFCDFDFSAQLKPFAATIPTRLALLNKDLIHLPSPNESQSPAFAANNLTSLDHRVGGLYVLLGSAIGGKIIAKRLQQHAWVDADKHLNFFKFEHHDIAREWNSFKVSLDEHIEVHRADLATVTAGAKMTFGLFAQ
ncbi:biliverdin-producing heme oxygenase [Halioxenophilus aromaticivorans]|uniref:Heme oxygenase n=1 Tax=Halioxenophilus aromaticivorans TaxID=1306992 RepID=A0AAV3U802_9ALTE